MNHYDNNRFKILRKQVPLFQISLLNNSQQIKPQIKPIYSAIQDLRIIHETIKKQQKQKLSEGITKSEQEKVRTIVWIDCQIKEKLSSEQPQGTSNCQCLFDLFEKVLVQENSIDIPSRTQNEKKQNRFIEQTFKSSQCSLCTLKPSENLNNTKKSDSTITSQLIQSKAFDQDQDQVVSNNILLIHMTVFVNLKVCDQLAKSLISMGRYFGNDLIVNCTRIQKNDTNLVSKFVQSSNSLRNYQEKGSIKTPQNKVYFLVGDLNQSVTKNDEQIIEFYEVKNFENSKKTSRVLQKIKSYILDSTLRCNYNDEISLNKFARKFQIASRILQKPSKTFKYNQSEEFSQQRVKQVTEELSKQSRLEEGRFITEKLQRFFNSMIDSKKQLLPMPVSIIKFKLQQVIEKQLKGVLDKVLLAKICSEYELRLQTRNDQQIQKLLIASMGHYLSASLTQLSNKKQPILLHPNKISSLIQQFYTIMQSNHIFISQVQLNKYIYPQLWSGYYKRLYEEYQKIIRSISVEQIRSQQITKDLKEEVSFLKGQVSELQKDLQIKSEYCRATEKELNQTKEVVNKNTDEVILWKEKYENSSIQLSNQVKIKKQLQKAMKQLEKSLSLNQSKLNESRQSTKQTDMQKLKFSIIQEFVSQSNKQSESLTKSFQIQLNTFKNQYRKIQQQLKEKSEILSEKEEFYKQKVNLLQQQLGFLKLNGFALVQSQVEKEMWRENIKRQVESQCGKKYDALKRQTDQKIEKYKFHVSELQKIKHQKNCQINKLGDDLYLVKKESMQWQDQLQLKERKIKEKDKKINELTKLVQDKNLLLNEKTNQNILLTDKIQQKMIRIELLEQDIHRYKDQLEKNQSINNMSVSGSFLKFEKDFIKPLSIQKRRTQVQPVSSLNKFTNQPSITPLKRTTRTKTVNEIDENFQLQKLIEQRRTIEKKKERCSQRQQVLSKIQGNLRMGAKSQIKLSHKESIHQRTQTAYKVLKESNRLLADKIDSVPNNFGLTECKKRLF